MTTFKMYFTLPLLSSLLALAACGIGGGGGGGGGGNPPPTATQIISGTAAAGAPIIGNVIIKDSVGVLRTAPIAADGGYTVDISGMTPPFMVRAEGTVGGRVYVLYSAATMADVNSTINVTPLTDLIVANVARQVAANYFDAGNFSGLTASELNAAEDTLQQRLQAVLTDLGVPGSVDLLRTAFATNHQGLDAALDVLRVTVDSISNTATIVNVLNNAAITDDLTTTDTGILNSTGTVTGLSDWNAIRARLSSFEAVFANGLPAANDPLLLAQFDQAGFLDSGNNLAAFLGKLTTDLKMVGFTFASVTLTSLTPATDFQNGRAVINFGIGDVTYGYDYINLVMTGIYDTTSGGTNWLIAGDQRIVEIGAKMRSTLGFNSLDSTQIQSGIDFGINADPAGNIDYAVVTGPGLPTTGGGANGNAAGLLLVMQPTFGGEFKVASPPYVGLATPTHPRAVDRGNIYTWSDGEIASLPSDNLTYAVTLYDDNGTPTNLMDDVALATYPFTLLKPPLPAGSLSAASFPVITGPSVSAMLNINATGGPLTVTWTLPTGLAADNLYAVRFYSDGSYDVEDADVSPADTRTTLQITPPTGTPTGGLFGVTATDYYKRNFSYRVWIP